MSFEEWKKKHFGEKELSFLTAIYLDDLKEAWNAALDEAVKVAVKFSNEYESAPCHMTAEEIKALKDE